MFKKIKVIKVSRHQKENIQYNKQLIHGNQELGHQNGFFTESIDELP